MPAIPMNAVIRLFRWLKRRQRQRLRNIDREVLFAAIKDAAPSHARFLDAVQLHMITNDAWNVDYEELSERDRELWDEVFR